MDIVFFPDENEHFPPNLGDWSVAKITKNHIDFVEPKGATTGDSQNAKNG